MAAAVMTVILRSLLDTILVNWDHLRAGNIVTRCFRLLGSQGIERLVGGLRVAAENWVQLSATHMPHMQPMVLEYAHQHLPKQNHPVM